MSENEARRRTKSDRKWLDSMAELVFKVEELVTKEHSQQVQEEANEFCDSLDVRWQSKSKSCIKSFRT